MAVNAIEVLYLTSGLFNAVPSKVVLTDLAKATNLDTLAKDLGNTPYAINAFPVTSNAEKAKVLAENLLGSSVTDKTAAVTALEGVLNANGGNVGVAALIAINEILKGGTYADAKAQLENRVKVAAAYVDSARGTEISNSILNEVTKDAATVTAAIEKLNSNNTPGSDYAGTPNDDTVSLLGGLASTIKIEGGQQGAAGDTLVITAQASATANVINLQNFADQNQTLDAQQRKVSPIIQGFENVDATGSTTEMNITGRDRTSELNTGSVASTQTGSVLKGGAYRDTVTGAAGADSIEGNAGNDVLNGGAGNDTIKGGADNDSITGGTGNDTIEDGTGNDTVSGGADNDTITIGGGVDLINGDEGNDTISFAADAAAGTSATVRTTVNGGAGNDSIDNTNATAASFLQVSGGANNDKITLGVATENINAGANNDIIVIKQDALDQEGTVAAGNIDVLNGNDGQDALQLLLTGGAATNTFLLKPVNGQYSGFEVIELIDESGNTNAKTYKIDLTDDFVANNFVNGQFLIDARGLPAGSNLVIDTSALTAASAAAFTAGNFQIWTSPSTDIRDQLNKTIDANYAINASNAALNATRAFYTNASDTTNKAGVHDATTGLITTAPAGATAYTVVGGTAETTTGGSTGGNTFTLTAGQDIVTSSSSNIAGFTNVFLSSGNDTITGGAGLLNANDILVDGSTTDNDVLNGQLVGAITPTNWTNIETLNFEMLGDTTGFTNTTGVSLAGATGYRTIGVSGANRTAHLDDVRSGTTVNVNSSMTVGVDMLTDLAADTLTVNLNGVTGGTLNVNGGANNINQLTINSNTSANTATIAMDAGQFGTAATDQLTIGGSQNLTLTAADTALTAQRINATTNTGVVTLSSNTAGAAIINANLMTGVDGFTFATSANTVTLQNLANNAGGTAVNLSAAVTTLNLSAREAGGVVNVTASNDIDNVTVNAGSASLATINLNTGTGTNFTGGLTVDLATIGGNTPTLNLTGAGAANTSQTITLTAGNFNASGFTVNAATATEGLTINGAGTGTIITDSAKNDTITGAAGNDVINLTTGGNDQVRFAHDSAANRDTVNGFSVGAATTTANNDFIGLTAGAFTGSGLEATTFATGAIGATAAGAVTVYNQAVNTNTDLSANTSQVMKLTSVVSTSWATAMGTSLLNVAANAVVTSIYFDATNGQAVVGIVNTETDNAAGDVLTSTDTFVEIARIGMTAADYANFGTNQILFY